MSIAVKMIKHPYITTDRKIRDGQPVISGTSIRVLDIAVRYEIMGMSTEDILVALPHLNLPQIHDALSYYYERKKDMDRTWKDAIKNTAALRNNRSSVLEKKIAKVKDIHG
jgi:uncharacterized protein (DUF433 family)